MAEKLDLDLTVRRPPKAPTTAGEPAPTLEEIYKPDAPVVQKLVVLDRSRAEAPPKKARTMSDIRI